MSLEAAAQTAIDGVVAIIGAVLRPFLLVITTVVNLAMFIVPSDSTVYSGLQSLLAAAGDFDRWFSTSLNNVLLTGVKEAIAAASEAIDFPLDKDDPFSPESLTDAINHKLDTDIGDVTDPESVKAGILAKAIEEINERIGFAAFSEPEDFGNPEHWGNLIASMVGEGLNASGFIAEHVCPTATVVLSALCKTVECNQCMGEEGEAECIAKREKAQRNRDKYSKKCSRSKR